MNDVNPRRNHLVRTADTLPQQLRVILIEKTASAPRTGTEVDMHHGLRSIDLAAVDGKRGECPGCERSSAATVAGFIEERWQARLGSGAQPAHQTKARQAERTSMIDQLDELTADQLDELLAGLIP